MHRKHSQVHGVAVHGCNSLVTHVPGRMIPSVFLVPSAKSTVWLTTLPSKYTLAFGTTDTSEKRVGTADMAD
jgi:hypothetical protein